MWHQKNLVKLENCLACGSRDLTLTLDLNDQPLANSYKDNKDDVQEEYPLAINHCNRCFHVQLTHAVNPELMFKEYLYVSGTSQTMKEHFKWFADFACEYYELVSADRPTSVLDIGCNDGSQLDQFLAKKVSTYGVDPAENLYERSSKSHKVYVDFFGIDFVKKHSKTYDIVVAQNVFAHNYDPVGFLLATKEILDKKSGLLFIQTSQADMILNNEFDTIYHEHISFYNINSMNELCKMAGMRLIDVTKCPLHGNSYIFVVSNSNFIRREAHIQNLIDMERRLGLLNPATYVNYAHQCDKVVNDLVSKIGEYRAYNINTPVVGYGAAAKGMTLLNYSKLQLDFIVDDNPLKQNKYTPGSNIKICSSDELKKYDQEILFIPLAWNFFDEIKSKIKTMRPDKNDMFCKYFPDVRIKIK